MPKQLTKDIFIERARKTHGNKYDYSQVDYINNRTKVCIVCPIHGAFWQAPNNHMKGVGCQKCARKYKPTAQEFAERAREIHGDKYDYSNVDYKNARTKICIVCPEHGEFWQVPDSHLRGYGCPRCGILKHQKTCLEKYGMPEYTQTKEFQEKAHISRKKNHTQPGSKIENKVFERLKEYFSESDIERQYSDDDRYPFNCDFYIKPLDLFIEYNGFYMHGFHWFDESDEKDRKQAEEWLYAENPQSDTAFETWVIRDTTKRETAKKNDLNYVVLWTKDDIENWFTDGCPIRKDWQ